MAAEVGHEHGVALGLKIRGQALEFLAAFALPRMEEDDRDDGAAFGQGAGVVRGVDASPSLVRRSTSSGGGGGAGGALPGGGPFSSPGGGGGGGPSVPAPDWPGKRPASRGNTTPSPCEDLTTPESPQSKPKCPATARTQGPPPTTDATCRCHHDSPLLLKEPTAPPPQVLIRYYHAKFGKRGAISRLGKLTR